MKKCSSCGKPNKEYEIFCKYCGNELNLFAGSCPRCKAPLEPLVKFCKKCGYDVSKPNNNYINPQNKPDKKLIIVFAVVGSIILIAIIVLLILVYKPSDNTSAIPTTVIDASASKTTNTIEESLGSNTGNIDTTVPSGSETTSIPQETSKDYKYILGDYRGFNIREDGDKFLKRINIFENGDYIRIECYSEKNDAPELEDYPSGVVDIPKNEIIISNNMISLDFYYEVDFRPKEDKIGYFDMKLKFYLDNTNMLEGIIYYNATFMNGKTVSHTYTFELERY